MQFRMFCGGGSGGRTSFEVKRHRMIAKYSMYWLDELEMRGAYFRMMMKMMKMTKMMMMKKMMLTMMRMMKMRMMKMMQMMMKMMMVMKMMMEVKMMMMIKHGRTSSTTWSNIIIKTFGQKSSNTWCAAILKQIFEHRTTPNRRLGGSNVEPPD
jgi:hypothetical protein